MTDTIMSIFGDTSKYLTKELSQEKDFQAIIDPEWKEHHRILGLRYSNFGICFEKKLEDLELDELGTVKGLLDDAFQNSIFEVSIQLREDNQEREIVDFYLIKEDLRI